MEIFLVSSRSPLLTWLSLGAAFLFEVFMEVKTGVMVMKDGKAWSETYSDGKSTEYGWIEPERARIHDPEYVKKPTDVTYKGCHYTQELLTAKVVKVRRTITVEVIND